MAKMIRIQARTVYTSELDPFISEHRGSQKSGVQISKTIHNSL